MKVKLSIDMFVIIFCLNILVSIVHHGYAVATNSTESSIGNNLVYPLRDYIFFKTKLSYD